MNALKPKCPKCHCPIPEKTIQSWGGRLAVAKRQVIRGEANAFKKCPRCGADCAAIQNKIIQHWQAKITVSKRPRRPQIERRARRKCTSCGLGPLGSRELYAHKISCPKRKLYRCPFCKTSDVLTIRELTEHIAESGHTAEQCPWCGEPGISLATHLPICQTPVRAVPGRKPIPVKCRWCSLVTSRNSMIVHEPICPERPNY